MNLLLVINLIWKTKKNININKLLPISGCSELRWVRSCVDPLQQCKGCREVYYLCLSPQFFISFIFFFSLPTLTRACCRDSMAV